MEDVLWPFGVFLSLFILFPILVCCTKTNLAALLLSQGDDVWLAITDG
jgi:hypothetical protein